MKTHVTSLEHPIKSFDRLKLICLGIIFFGCLLRFFEIFQNSFIFYDEGMYLQHNAALLEKIQEFPPKDTNELFAILRILFLSALTTAKWLWFFISNLRVFVDGPDAFYFTRVVSAVCGCLTVWVTYLFARKYFRSQEMALLSAAVLAILPSHIFYSRLAMQESFSALCFLAGIYWYCSRPGISWRIVLSGVFLSAVYFTNYRMIIIPVLLVVLEGITSLSEKRQLHWLKLFLSVLIFAAIILFFGLLNNGSNLFITTAWMGRQAELASQQWQWLNIFSFPYGMARLDGWIFFLTILFNLLFILKKDWRKVLPVSLVFAQMFIFSFASEKGARYLCVILPFASMAAALAVEFLWTHTEHFKRWAPGFLIGLFLFSLAAKAVAVVDTPRGYEQAVHYIKSKNPQAKILATQPIIVGLLFGSSNEVAPVPKDFRELVIRYAQGFRYLIVDPQAYVSWTQSGFRFTTPLTDYLGFMRDRLPPDIRIPQLNQALLERFVMDHNENLPASISFLNNPNAGYGDIYVYDLGRSLAIMEKMIQAASMKPGEK